MENYREKIVIEMYKKGFSINFIAIKLRTKEKYIINVLKKYNLYKENIEKIKDNGIKLRREEEIYDLYTKELYSMIKIGKIFGITIDEIKEIIKNNKGKIEEIKKIKNKKKKKELNNIEILEREEKIYDLYTKKLYSLEKIGNIYDITRERVRQILRNKIKKDILKEYEDEILPEELNLLLIAANEELKEIVKNKINKIKKNKINKIKEFIINNNINYENYNSFLEFSKKINIENIKYTDIIKALPEIKDYFNNNKKWSRYYDCCIVCGTKIIKHKVNGFCENCYYKSDIWKDIQKKSFKKYKKERISKQKEYQKIRNSNPENIKKLKEINNKKNYGGNREIVIKKAGYKCSACGKTREQCYKEYGKDLFVLHKNMDKSDNRLDNLSVYCKTCFEKNILKYAKYVRINKNLKN